jgi:hypothetical protein
MTYVSNHTNECAARDAIRDELWRQMAEFERRAGPVTTIPPQRRAPDTRVDLVIRADVADKENRPECIKRRRGRPKGSSTPAPVAMIHDIKARMERSGIRQKQVADAMNVGHTYISNIMNGYHNASPVVAERILSEVIKLESAPPLPIVRGRGYPKWVERENMLELAKRHRLVAREIGRQSGVKPASRAAEYLSGRKTPHPDLARSMERVIIMMVEEAK